MSPTAPNMDDPAVVSYRLHQIEKSLDGIRSGIQESLTNLATREYVDIRLRNIEESNKNILLDIKDREKADRNKDFQLKLAIFIALLSPVVAAVVGIVIKSN